MENAQFSDILHQLAGLNYTQLKKLRHHVEQQISENQVGKAIADREASIASCPHCESFDLSKWGNTPQGRQRYRCKSCHKTFNSMTGTALYRLRQPEKWSLYSEHMWLSCTLREAANNLGVNLKTAF